MKKHPNILFVMADQHRYDCVGSSRKYPVVTPNLDKLAAEGCRFTNAYTSSPICCPARQAFLCGRRSESLGAYWNHNITLPIATISPDDYSFARDLEAGGYSTSFIGIWDCSPDYGPDAYGYAYTDIKERAEYNKWYAEKYGKRDIGWFGIVEELPFEDSHPAWIANRACARLEREAASGRPFFMNVAIAEPHPTYRPSRESYDRTNAPVKWDGFDDDFEGKPYIQRQQPVSWAMQDMTWEDWAPAVQRYYGAITDVDSAVGMLIAKVKELGLEDDTIIIYTADHGDMCGSHHMFDKHYVLYDDVVHVPLIIKIPGKSASVTDAYVVNTLDLVPTLLELAGCECTAKEIHGKSLMGPLNGEEGLRTSAVFTHNGAQFGLYCTRGIKKGNMKYSWNPTDTDELYDLSNDPGELHNIIHDEAYADVLKELRRELYDTLIAEGDGLAARFPNWIAVPHLLEGRKL